MGYSLPQIRQNGVQNVLCGNIKIKIILKNKQKNSQIAKVKIVPRKTFYSRNRHGCHKDVTVTFFDISSDIICEKNQNRDLASHKKIMMMSS